MKGFIEEAAHQAQFAKHWLELGQLLDSALFGHTETLQAGHLWEEVSFTSLAEQFWIVDVSLKLDKQVRSSSPELTALYVAHISKRLAHYDKVI